MHVNSGRVLVARDVTFDESTLYHQLLKTKAAKIMLESAEQDEDSEIEDKPPMPPKDMVQPPKAMIQSLDARVQLPNAAGLPRGINPIDDSDDDLTPPPETPPPESPPPETPPLKPRRSGTDAAKIRITMMIEQGPKTYRAHQRNRSHQKKGSALAKQNQRDKSTTTIAMKKRTAAIDSRRRIDPGASVPAPARPQEEGAHRNPHNRVGSRKGLAEKATDATRRPTSKR